jgi:hypothetical protein
MAKTQDCSSNSTLATRELSRQAQGWLLDGEVRQLSKDTMAMQKKIDR